MSGANEKRNESATMRRRADSVMRETWLLLALMVASLTANPMELAAVQAAESAEQQGQKPHHEADSERDTGKQDEEKSSEQGVLKLIQIGKSVTLQLGGFAKVDYIQDFDPIGNADQFKANSIPVEGDTDAGLGGSTNISAKQTRLSFDVRADESAGGLRAYVEGDFFGSGTAFRLRHGYGEWKGLLGGQTWTTFQDISARPFTLDYEGPDSEIFVRQPMIRFTGTPSDRLEWSVAVEDRDSQVTVPTDVSGSGRSEFPDIPGRIRFKSKRGHLQVAGMVRQLRFVSDGGTTEATVTGWGVNLSGKTSVLKRDAIMGHVGFGSGVGRYIEAFGGENSDAVLTPDGELIALDAWSFVLGYTRHWSERFNSTLSGGMAKLDNDPSQPGGAIRFIRSAHANLVYASSRLLTICGDRRRTDVGTT